MSKSNNTKASNSSCILKLGFSEIRISAVIHTSVGIYPHWRWPLFEYHLHKYIPNGFLDFYTVSIHPYYIAVITLHYLLSDQFSSTTLQSKHCHYSKHISNFCLLLHVVLQSEYIFVIKRKTVMLCMLPKNSFIALVLP